MGLLDYCFTPSEYVLLNADKFAPEAKDNDRFVLLLSDGYVNGPVLSTLLIMAAIVANEAEGGLEVEYRESKTFLRLSRSAQVYLKPVGLAPNWNGYTLEAAVIFMAGQFIATQQESTVYNVVNTLVRENTKNPWQKIADLVEWGLASSNWLMPVEGEAAAAFSIPFICPAKVRDLALSQPEEPYRALLTNYKNSHPQIWRQMQEDIDRAFTDRKRGV